MATLPTLNTISYFRVYIHRIALKQQYSFEIHAHFQSFRGGTCTPIENHWYRAVNLCPFLCLQHSWSVLHRRNPLNLVVGVLCCGSPPSAPHPGIISSRHRQSRGRTRESEIKVFKARSCSHLTVRKWKHNIAVGQWQFRDAKPWNVFSNVIEMRGSI